MDMNASPAGIPDRGIMVCLVDDDAIMQDLISRYLCRLGCKFEVAVNPQRALEIIACRNFDLVISDLCMPNMEDGLQLIAQIRALNPALPVAVMSAEMGQSTQDTSISSGAFACLEKPISSDDLAKVLDKVSSACTTGSETK